MRWYLIYTKVNEESKVTRILSKENHICYVPILRKRTFIGRNRVEMTQPLFPRYVFLKTAIEKNYWKIKYTRGVISFVEFGDGPAVVEDNIISMIKSREKDGVITLPRKKRRFNKNEMVTINRGVLKDIDAVFEEYLSDGERVMLLLENVSSNIKVNIGTQYL